MRITKLEYKPMSSVVCKRRGPVSYQRVGNEARERAISESYLNHLAVVAPDGVLTVYCSRQC